MIPSSTHLNPETCLLSGEFCDRTLEADYRLASYETLRKHTWQVFTLVLIALTALNLVDYLYASDVPGIITISIIRYVVLVLPAYVILMALRRARYQAIDRMVLIFALWIVADSILMIHVFRDHPVMMAARLPLFAMIANIMFSPSAFHRAIMNGVAWPAILIAFWVMTPDLSSSVPAITVILSVAFMFGIVAGTWLIRLRRHDYFRASEQERANESLRRYKHELEQAMLAKTMFLSNVSHELRTPLNAIIGFSDMLNMQMYGPIGSPKYREYVQDIQNSGYHLLDLINDILDLNRLEVGKAAMSPEWNPVEQALLECRKIVLAAHRHIDPERIQLGEVANVHVSYDHRSLHQILVNLVTNAVKYAGDTACITLECRLASDGACVFHVTDNGAGMNEATLFRLMKPFEQADSSVARDTEGWGLGLPLANALALANDSELLIESTPGHGTRARLVVAATRVEVDNRTSERALALSA